MIDKLIERLRAKRQVYNGRNTFRDEIINPDGPEAADLIERLTSAPAGEDALIGALGTCRKRLAAMSHVEGGTLDQNCLYLIGVIDNALSTAPSPSPVARVPDRETLAKALYEALNASPTCHDWDGCGLDDEHPGARLRYYQQADAILTLFTASPSDGWQPIETAPRDRPILLASQAVWNAGEGPKWSITVGYWDAEFEYDNDAYRGAWTDDTVASWGYEERTELCPTHWQPLPQAPTGDQP